MVQRRNFDRRTKWSVNTAPPALVDALRSAVNQARTKKLAPVLSRSKAHARILGEMDNRFFVNPGRVENRNAFARENADWQLPWTLPWVAAAYAKGEHHFMNPYEEWPRDFNPLKVMFEKDRNSRIASDTTKVLRQAHIANPLKVTIIRAGVPSPPADFPCPDRFFSYLVSLRDMRTFHRYI